MFPSADTSACSPLPSSGYRGRSLRKPCGSPPSQVLRCRKTAAFRFVNSVGIATSRVFGAESSRPASLLCTLRTHQSPGEWQHSLPACLLDCDRAGLAPAGFHQEVSPSHLRFLLFQTFPSTITTSALSSTFLSTL